MFGSERVFCFQHHFTLNFFFFSLFLTISAFQLHESHPEKLLSGWNFDHSSNFTANLMFVQPTAIIEIPEDPNECGVCEDCGLPNPQPMMLGYCHGAFINPVFDQLPNRLHCGITNNLPSVKKLTGSHSLFVKSFG
jgi:hypothetical protein